MSKIRPQKKSENTNIKIFLRAKKNVKSRYNNKEGFPRQILAAAVFAENRDSRVHSKGCGDVGGLPRIVR